VELAEKGGCRALRGGVGLIVTAMDLGVFVIGDGLEEAKGVFAPARVEAVGKDSVGCCVVAGQFQLGIALNHFAIIGDAKFGPDLQDDFHFII
jgi:hypothetical protein